MASDTEKSAFSSSQPNRPVIAFTNGVGEPKKIDVERSLSEIPSGGDLDSTFSGRDKNDFVFACPRVPLAPITFNFDYDPDIFFSNFINRQPLQFAYQNVYKDGSVSALSPYSDVAIPPTILSLGTASLGDRNVENVCTLSIPGQGSEVSFVNLIFREGNNGSPFIFDKIKNENYSDNSNYTHIGGQIMGVYLFKNDKTGVILGDTERFKTFDNLPREAKAQEVADDRLMYGNYKEGYPNIDVDASLSVELRDAPAPGYSFEVKAVPYLFREKVNNNTDYGNNVALRSNAGFVVDFSSCPEVILPGEYTLNVLVNPTKNFHTYIGAGDVNWHPENKEITGWNGNLRVEGYASTQGGGLLGSVYDSGYRKQTAGIGQIDVTNGGQTFTSATGYNGTTYTTPGVSVTWNSEGGSGSNPVGAVSTSPLIIKGAPIAFKASISVDLETTRDKLEDSFAHVMYGLPFDKTPIVLDGNGSVTFPANELEASNKEVSIDLNLADESFFQHDSEGNSDLICAANGAAYGAAGFFIVNKATMRFFLETGVNCFGVSAGKVNFDNQSSLSEGWGMKLCLAHIVDIDVKSCIPTPHLDFGSYVNPSLNENNGQLVGAENLPGAFSEEIGIVNAGKARRTLSAGTSTYDYFVDSNNSRLLCWPDQRVQFCPDIAATTPELYGPAQQKSTVGIGSGLQAVLSSNMEDYAIKSEVPTTTTGAWNNSFLPAPIRGWYVFDNLKDRYTDQQWYEKFGFGLATDALNGSEASASEADLLITGNPGTLLGSGVNSRSSMWVGQLKNHSFVDGSQNYSLLGLNRGYTSTTATSLTALLGAEVNKISVVDGAIGPGGLDGYGCKMFGEHEIKFEYEGSSLNGYQGIKNRDVKSKNSKGSITNFRLLGYVDNMPFLLNNEVFFNSYRQSNSFFSPPVSDSKFAEINTASNATGNIPLFLSVASQGYQNIPSYNTAYSYGDSYDITSLFVPSTLESVTEGSDSIIGLLDVGSLDGSVTPELYPAEVDTVAGSVLKPNRIVKFSPPLSSGGGMNTPIFNISSNIGVLGNTSFKSSSSHEFGIVYFDERGRHGSVQSLGSVYVPGYSGQERASSDLGRALVRLQLNSQPPSWANAYKIVYAGNNTTSEFIQYSTSKAFLEKGESASADQSRIYIPLQYLQSSDISYAEAYGAVSQDDGTKFLYRHAPGDVLTIIQHSNSSGNVITTPKPYRFRVLEVKTLDPDMTNHPLFPDNVEPSTDIRRQGEFLVIENNPSAEGFTVADIQAETSKWKDRVIFEVSRPAKELSEEARPYYETPYGGQVTVGGNHQYSDILMSKGDVYFRQVPVNSNTLLGSTFTPLLTGPVDEPTRSSPNFVSYFLETEGATDLYKSDSKAIGRVHFLDPNASEFNRISSVSFSEKTFSGSADVNYFSFPQTGNFKDLPQGNGDLQKLYSDNVLLTAYQSSKISVLPISRDVLETGGSDMIVKSSKILGTPTELKTSYSIHGHPESVVVVDGDHYFFDKRARKIVMLKGGRTPIVISDMRVDSYVRRITDSWLEDEWRAFIGHDPDSDELLFCLVTNNDLNSKPEDHPVGTLAFDLKSKKYWKTRYSYVSQFFSKVGGRLMSGWNRKNSSQWYPFVHAGDSSFNTFFGGSPALTSFKAVMNKSPESAKEFVMVNTSSDKVVNAKISTDQTNQPASFKIWKDYDGVKYAEVPKKPVPVSEIHKNQKLTWTPTYPSSEGSKPSNIIRFEKDGFDSVVVVKMFIPLSNPIWRAPIPSGKKTVLVERTSLSSEYYACGNHPDSDVYFDRGAYIGSSYKVDSEFGAIEFRMSWNKFLTQDSAGWSSVVSLSTTGTRISDLIASIASGSDFNADGTVSSNTEIDIDGDGFSDEQKGDLARLFLVPILSCTNITDASARLLSSGELPVINFNADFNEDGIVNTADLLALLGDFNTPGGGSDFDLTGDGFATTEDLLALLSEFGNEVIYGCTDPSATNYDPSAQFDNGSCTYNGGGDDTDNDTGGGSEPEDVNVWWLANESQNKRVYVGYSNVIDGVHMKGKHATIEILSNPTGPDLNLDSIMVDFNPLNKNAGKGMLKQQSRKKK